MQLETAWWSRRKRPLPEPPERAGIVRRIARSLGVPDVPQVPSLLLLFTTAVFAFWAGTASDWHWGVSTSAVVLAVTLAYYVFRVVVACESSYSTPRFQQELDRWGHVRDAL